MQSTEPWLSLYFYFPFQFARFSSINVKIGSPETNFLETSAQGGHWLSAWVETTLKVENQISGVVLKAVSSRLAEEKNNWV